MDRLRQPRLPESDSLVSTKTCAINLDKEMEIRASDDSGVMA